MKLFRLNFYLMLLAALGCATSPREVALIMERVPEGARLTNVATSLSELKRQLQPHIVWQGENDRSWAFMWYREEEGKPVFVLDRAYPLINEGKQVFGMIDVRADEGLGYEHPIRQFSKLKYYREVVRLDDRRRDGNHSFVELVSTGPGGVKIYKVVYCSMNGDRAHQEMMECCLVLVTPDREVKLVAKDLPNEAISKSGMIGSGWQASYQMDWTGGSKSQPIQILVREKTEHYETGEGATLPSLSIGRIGLLKGRLPMHVEWDPNQYVGGDGKLTVVGLSELMMKYFSSWHDAEWVTKEQREQVASHWRNELIRLNPSLPNGRPVHHLQNIIVPDGYAFDREVYKRVGPPAHRTQQVHK